MENQNLTTAARLRDYIAFMLPWAHGHQLKSIGDYVGSIIEQQTACQAQLARSFGNQEAAVKRLSRLLHHERLDPRLFADAVLLQTIHQLPTHGKVRLAIDWTIEDKQHLLVVSRIVGRRAVPIYWRAYDASVLKGRMKRYEMAVIRRAVGRVMQAGGKRRVMVTADRGFADVALFNLLTQLGVAFIICVKAARMSIFRANGANWDSSNFGAMSITAALVLSLIVKAAPNLYGFPRVEPEIETATGGCGMWWPIVLMVPAKPPKNILVVLVVKKASGMPHGGWVLPRPGLPKSKPGRACSPCLPSPYG